MKNLVFTMLLGMGLISSCGSQNVTVNNEEVELEDGIYAKIETNKGDILFRFETEKAPMTSANFIALAEGNMPEASADYQGKPYYDGLTFHRVIPQFMIQGGDPDGTGGGGPGYQFPNETDNDLTHKKGVVSMANAGPNTNGSQFFITVAETKQLDGGYSIFGEVVKGQNVADEISKVPTNQANKPIDPVVMNKVTIIRKGDAAENFDAPAVFEQGKKDAQQKIDNAKAEQRKADEARLAAQESQLAKYKEGAEQTEKGVFYKVLEEGKGPKPAEGQKVLINYTGYLPDGTIFDSSIEEKAKESGNYNPQRPYQPLAVKISPDERLIEGWKDGLKLMNVGDKFQLIIPPHMGYGERGYPPIIPGNSWLIFDMEMVAIQE